LKQKYNQVKVNFKPEDFELLQNLADEAGLTKAEFIRKSLGDFSVKNTRSPKGGVKKNIDSDTLYAVAKIGTNLNQISRYCHIKRRLNQDVLASLIEIETDMKSLIK